jgi:hypothetical protein
METLPLFSISTLSCHTIKYLNAEKEGKIQLNLLTTLKHATRFQY